MTDVDAVLAQIRALLGTGDPPQWPARSFGAAVASVPTWKGAASDQAHVVSQTLNARRQRLADAYNAVGPLVGRAGQISAGARSRVDAITHQWQADKTAFAPLAGTPAGKLALLQLGQLRIGEAGAVLKHAQSEFTQLSSGVYGATGQLPEHGGGVHGVDFKLAPGMASGDINAIDAANRRLLQEMLDEYNRLPEGQIKRDRLADIAGIQEALQVPGSHLIFLEKPQNPADMIPAATSVGDPFTADRVSVTVPGVSGMTRGTIAGMTREAADLRNEALSIADRVGGTKNIATIAWVGYQPPPNLGSSEMMFDDLAQVGAPKLQTFLANLDSASLNPNHTIALFGHSYGSLVSGIALENGASQYVDNAVLYGSPGFGATTPAELGMNDNNFFVMTAKDDLIRSIAPLAPLHGWGSNPNEIIYEGHGHSRYRFTHLATDPGWTPIPGYEYKTGAYEHPDYGRDAGARMTGYNLAAILLDRPDLAVRENP